jgi:hypothetical protein
VGRARGVYFLRDLPRFAFFFPPFDFLLAFFAAIPKYPKSPAVYAYMYEPGFSRNGIPIQQLLTVLQIH